MNRIIFLISCISIAGCTSDSGEELSGNYFFRDEGPNTKDILSHSPHGKHIYSKVLNYAFNKQFIIAEQQPIFDEYRSMIAFELRNDLLKYSKNSAEDLITTEELADSILRKDRYYLRIFSHKINFWIINIKQDSLIGPLTLNEFEIKRRQLNIPESLKLGIIDK